MGIKVIEQGTTHDGTKGIVCFESDVAGPNFSSAISELTSGSTRHEAIKVAGMKGLPDPRVEGLNNAAYPVDAEGKPVTNPLTQQVHRYRIDIPVTRRLV